MYFALLKMVKYMLNNWKIQELEKRVQEIRCGIISMFSYGKAHHFGGSLSCVELVTCVYFYKMNFSKENMHDPNRDRFIMSKGHSVPTQYAVLSLLGIIPQKELATIKQIGTRLQGHPDILKTPGLEAPTGSLGQGLSFANGIALSCRKDGNAPRIFVLLGDGEVQEGQVWEAAMTTSHYSLSNICVIVDRNKFQSQGSVSGMMEVEPLEDKFTAFGWKSFRVDGHDISDICKTLDLVDREENKPCAVIADTVKGKGISFLENTYKYHNYKLSEDEYLRAVKELGC